MAGTSGTTTFGELVRAYSGDPTTVTLDRLRAAVVAAPTFDPDLDLRRTLEPLLIAGDHEGVATTISDLMPGAALNATAHRMLSFALAALGDEAGARREARMSRLSISSVLATGDGSEERPWSVLRVADEYDVLQVKGLVSTRQSVSLVDGQLLDRHELPSGAAVHFVIAADRPAEVTG